MIQLNEVETDLGYKIKVADCYFGKGNIGFGNKLDKGELWLTNSTEKDETNWNPDTPLQEIIPEGDICVVLHFTKKKSIENMILNLKEILDTLP